MSETPSDDDLMALVSAGDRRAFADLVERHKDAVVRYLARLSGSPDRAEDLGQETFLRLFHSARRYRREGYLPAYLFRIATNLLRSEERRERRWRLLAPLFARDLVLQPAAAVGLLHDEAKCQVAAAVAALPVRLRVPLVLHEIEGWPYAEIARQLACREGTVKSRIHRGRLALRARLEPYWNGGATWPSSPETAATTLSATD
ncbi:MAG TPA: RNA polymerase sigma factor [Thermoanaerobaculia bacterium]|nr:RNA polymerase sigma factor [Thermoanaerobaculia bacterium]